MKKMISVPEIILLIGFLMIGVGLYLIYMPAMFIVCGAMLIYAGWPKGASNNDNK